MARGHSHNSGSKSQRRFEEALALHQAGDLNEAQKRYRQISRKQPRHAHAFSLFDAAGFARQLEQALAVMVECQREGLPPVPLAVNADGVCRSLAAESVAHA